MGKHVLICTVAVVRIRDISQYGDVEPTQAELTPAYRDD